ncbi:MAG: hypothetical protein AAF581_14750 [Planctomycetota bacterium]
MLRKTALCTALCFFATTPLLAGKGGTLPFNTDLEKAPAAARDVGKAQVYYFTKDH